MSHCGSIYILIISGPVWSKIFRWLASDILLMDWGCFRLQKITYSFESWLNMPIYHDRCCGIIWSGRRLLKIDDPDLLWLGLGAGSKNRKKSKTMAEVPGLISWKTYHQQWHELGRPLCSETDVRNLSCWDSRRCLKRGKRRHHDKDCELSV
jgi:hypothetical protein